MIGVCIPAHDEEDLIGRCLDSVFCAAAHADLQGETVAVVVVLDSCQDATESAVRRWPAIPLSIAARNVGKARALGSEYLLLLGARWLAFTDADTTVSPSWLADQLALQSDVVCGTVQVADWSAHGVQADTARRHFETTYTDRDGHRHVHGANLGISAWHYRQAGGFDARTCGEDQDLVDRLAAGGARIAWSARPRVMTSGRAYSRVADGFAGALRQGWALPCDAPPALPVLQSALAQQALALPQPQAGSSTR
ncbi:glycosyltransferase [Delftia tsuruhatensis]|uniref:glycosyltransferase n=1 Tax=Delftia tsuruhatensis TaxID=180282 RepID=UPI0030D3C4C2